MIKIYICTIKPETMLPTIFITLCIIAISVVLLGIKILVKKDGRFPQTHISGNNALRKKGIVCAKSMDRQDQKRKTLFEMMES